MIGKSIGKIIGKDIIRYVGKVRRGANAVTFQIDYKDEGLTSTEIDAILAELASPAGLAYLATLTLPIIDLRGNDTRTSGSDTDYATLIAAGVQIWEDVVNPAFEITIDTTKAGSATDTFILPLYSSAIAYDAHLTSSDGHDQDIIGAFITGVTLTFSVSGIYKISITENSVGGFPRIFFNGGGDILKLSSIDNWGDIKWQNMGASFKGCANVLANYSDIPHTFDVTDFNSMLRDCDAFNGELLFDTVNGTNFSAMMWSSNAFKQSLALLDISSATNLSNICFGIDINEAGTTTNLDDTLVSWKNQAELLDITGLTPNFGTSKYSTVGETALDYLQDIKGWTIVSGGLAI